MALTAENLAVKHKIPRDKVDLFALRSQRLYKAAYENGIFWSVGFFGLNLMRSIFL